jgi:hypothetical protein
MVGMVNGLLRAMSYKFTISNILLLILVIRFPPFLAVEPTLSKENPLM